MFIKKNLLILKKLFDKDGKLNNHDVYLDTMVQKGEKRSREALASADDDGVVSLSDYEDDDEEW
jgi:hypothetical protein